jgi:hypothetical protein
MYVSGDSLLGHIGVQVPRDTTQDSAGASSEAAIPRGSTPRSPSARRHLSQPVEIERHDHPDLAAKPVRPGPDAECGTFKPGAASASRSEPHAQGASNRLGGSRALTASLDTKHKQSFRVRPADRDRAPAAGAAGPRLRVRLGDRCHAVRAGGGPAGVRSAARSSSGWQRSRPAMVRASATARAAAPASCRPVRYQAWSSRPWARW